MWWREPAARDRLEAELRRINEGRRLSRPDPGDELVAHAAQRLVAYGTLAPGRQNHHLLAGAGGTWSDVVIRGHLHGAGWGFTAGYPALIPDADGPRHAVKMLTAAALPQHWPRLDAFEGNEYCRLLIAAESEGAIDVANVYALRALITLPDPRSA